MQAAATAVAWRCRFSGAATRVIRTLMTTPRAEQTPLFSRRELGVLLHPTSLFGSEDVGTLGRHAFAFVDWLEQAGATIWQILPLTPNGLHNSPYFSLSAFAGNPWLIDLDTLRQHGLLEGHTPGTVRDARVPFADLPDTKLPLLLAAAAAFLGMPHHPLWPAFQAFRERESWLEYTAHFFALKEEHAGAPWWTWEPGLRERRPGAVARSRVALAHRIEVWEAVLFFFEQQWRALRAYANGKGIRVLGDLPIYVHHDSADVWRHSEQFRLGDDGRMTVQSGVPPDYFSATGQLWGNPIYDWNRMAPDGFSWWIARLRRCAALTDIVRLDHFRALSAYWEIPGDAQDARSGRWVPGPGQQFFDTVARHFPAMPFVAEDLGTLDESVLALRDHNRLFGMRILQFGFDGLPDNLHRPDVFPEGSIAYTGTHDNDTLRGWWESLDAGQRATVAAYYQFRPDDPPGKVVWSLIEAAVACRSQIAVIPLQDLLVLDTRARMNDPARFVGNWEWRLPPDGLSDELARSLRRLRDRYR
jgi:4-alpha-glucanotransferase